MNPRTYRYTMLGLTLLLAVVGVGLLAVVPQMAQSPPTVNGVTGPAASGLGDYFDVPAFELVDQDAQPFARDDLAGKVWVADFIFTQCRGICPLLSNRMAELQDRLAHDHPELGDVRLVSFSVDPENDTPDRLRDFADHFDADLGRWTFLTGQREQIWPLIEQGFRLPVEETPANTEMPILHSDKFVLVDGTGRIRGYYDALEPGELDRLIEDLTHLRN